VRTPCRRLKSWVRPLVAVFFVLGGANSVANVIPWTPLGISSPQFESHAAFDPASGDLYFVRSSPKFEGWRILVSRCAVQGWSKPEPAPFAGDGVEADPWFTPDGKSLYFISTRTTDGVKRKDLDIWRIARTDAGVWETPMRLPEPVNSSAQEWFPRLSRDGWLYFGSGRAGGQGKTDIWRARVDAQERWTVANLGPEINTAGDEYEPLISPDGTMMIVMADGGLYISHRAGDAWTKRTKLSAEVNVNGSEIGAAFSPSGNALLFARDTGSPLSGEFFIWQIGVPEPWPTPCPTH
jgi:WD40-like Beta Propeller Repeat